MQNQQGINSFWEELQYPIRLEYQDLNNDWQEFYTAQTDEECKYRLTALGLDTSSDFKNVRIVEHNNNIVLQTSRAEMDEFNETYRAKTKSALAPLSKLINASPEKSIETAIELIAGGLAAQHFTIPPDANVQLNHEILHSINFCEFPDCVTTQIRTNQDPSDIYTASINFWKHAHPTQKATIQEYIPEVFEPIKPITSGLAVQIPEPPYEPSENGNPQYRGPAITFTPEEVHHNIKGFLILLCASIIRDFWVLETRTQKQQYTRHTEKTRERTGRGKQRKLKVTKNYTYIPRFKYDLETYEVNKTIQHQTRAKLSPHLVSGHLRQLPNGWKVSPEATENAKDFGLTIPHGFTFVQPHQRGAIEQLRTYRSQSAFRMLFSG